MAALPDEDVQEHSPSNHPDVLPSAFLNMHFFIVQDTRKQHYRPELHFIQTRAQEYAHTT